MGQAGRPTRAGKPLVSSAVGQPKYAQTTRLRCVACALATGLYSQGLGIGLSERVRKGS